MTIRNDANEFLVSVKDNGGDAGMFWLPMKMFSLRKNGFANLGAGAARKNYLGEKELKQFERIVTASWNCRISSGKASAYVNG